MTDTRDVGTRRAAARVRRTDAAWGWSLARLAMRRTREGARRLTDRPSPRPTRSFEPVWVASNVIRQLTPADETAWRRSMSANESRMRRWWNVEGDWAVNVDHVAFAAHYTQWSRRAREGSGVALAMCTESGLVGELLVWNLDAAAGTAELGLWARPNGLSARVMLPLLGGAIDQLFRRYGVQRIDAPVASGNQAPRKVLEFANFVNEGTLAQWRRLHGDMVDHDMYGLTPERWELGRRRIYRLQPWEPAINPPD